MLLSAEPPNLTCSFAAYHRPNCPRPAPIWPCSSIGRATMICSGVRGFVSHRGLRFFSSFSVRVHFLSRTIAQEVSSGILYLILLSGQTLLVIPSLTCSFAANYRLNFPLPAPVWHCSSVGRATVICSERSWVQTPPWVRSNATLATCCRYINIINLTILPTVFGLAGNLSGTSYRCYWCLLDSYLVGRPCRPC